MSSAAVARDTVLCPAPHKNGRRVARPSRSPSPARRWRRVAGGALVRARLVDQRPVHRNHRRRLCRRQRHPDRAACRRVRREVLVTTTSACSAGQLLIRLDARDFLAALDHAAAVVAARDAALDSLHAQYALQQSVIRQQEADLAAKTARAGFTVTDAERYRTLASTAAGSRQDAQRATTSEQEARAAVAATTAALDAARQKLKVLDADVAEATAAAAQARSDLATAQLNLGYTDIRAPIDGYVGNREAQVGAYVSAGTYLVSIVPAAGLWVDANFKEDQLARMVPGESATIAADVLPGHAFHGHVASLAPGTGAVFSVIPPENATGNFTKIVQRVPVRVLLDAGDDKLPLLRPGLSITASVDTREPGSAPK